MWINVNKCSGPDAIGGRTWKFCADQLSGVLGHLVQSSIDQHFVPSLWKMSTVIPVPKRSAPKQLNDLRPFAPTSLVMETLQKDRDVSHSFSLLFNPFLIHYSLHTGQEGMSKMASCAFRINCISTWSCHSLMLEFSLLILFCVQYYATSYLSSNANFKNKFSAWLALWIVDVNKCLWTCPQLELSLIMNPPRGVSFLPLSTLRIQMTAAVTKKTVTWLRLLMTVLHLSPSGNTRWSGCSPRWLDRMV